MARIRIKASQGVGPLGIGASDIDVQISVDETAGTDEFTSRLISELSRSAEGLIRAVSGAPLGTPPEEWADAPLPDGALRSDRREQTQQEGF